MKDSNDNVFINVIYDKQKPESFGKVIGSASEFNTLRSQSIEFHSSDTAVIKANQSQFYKTFYGTANKATSTGTSAEAPSTPSSSSNSSSSKKSSITTAEINGWPTLRRGNKSVYVGQLQQLLKDLGYAEVGAVDKSFGPKTQAAVKHFQSDKGISSDGVVGPITKSKLKEALGTPTKTTTTTTASSTTSSSSGGGKLTSGGIFTGEYTLSEVQSTLNNLYNSAPSVVKTRATKIASIMSNADSYINQHYMKE
jgi:peptidoglycan hydrolase-like protein with peptidoglycan-binding domain